MSSIRDAAVSIFSCGNVILIVTGTQPARSATSPIRAADFSPCMGLPPLVCGCRHHPRQKREREILDVDRLHLGGKDPEALLPKKSKRDSNLLLHHSHL